MTTDTTDTTATAATAAARVARLRQRFKWAVSDAIVMTWRNLLHWTRVRALIVFSTVSPVMFILLFRYVFGGAIKVPGVNYVDYLMPGIFVWSIAFGATRTGIALALDINEGMIDRFRSLPMARSAVLAGRTAGDTIRNTLVTLLMVGVGYLVGFRFRAGIVPAVGAILVVVLFGLAYSWACAANGLAVKNVEAVQTSTALWTLPMTFASSAFVPVETMPGWLQAFAKLNPITIVVNATRDLSGGGPETAAHVWQAVAWIVALLLVFVPLSVRKYRQAT